MTPEVWLGAGIVIGGAALTLLTAYLIQKDKE